MNNLDKLVEIIYKRMITNCGGNIFVNNSGNGVLKDALGTFPNVYVQLEVGKPRLVVILDGIPQISNTYIQPLNRALKDAFKKEIKTVILTKLKDDRIVQDAVRAELTKHPELLKGE